MAQMGRPSDFTEELAIKICTQLGSGISLRTVCASPDMPSFQTVFTWLRDNKHFLDQYERAKQESADAMIEDMLAIADESGEVVTGKDNSDSARVNANKLRVDTRKWIASRLKPKKYGDKLDLTTGGDKLPTPIYGGKSTGK